MGQQNRFLFSLRIVMEILSLAADAVLVLLITAAVYYVCVKKSPEIPKPRVDYSKAMVAEADPSLPKFTREELKKYNGHDGQPIYIGVANKVFDCMAGERFYGIGGAYSMFAGRDVSRAAGKFSTDEKYLDNWNVDDLTH